MYEELREKIAKELYDQWSWATSGNWEDLDPLSQGDYKESADKILSIIADYCVAGSNKEGGVSMGRLLTDEEITEAIISLPDEVGIATTRNDEERAIAVAQRDLTRKETLKAVGEFIERHDGLILPKYIEALKRGEMPEEAK